MMLIVVVVLRFLWIAGILPFVVASLPISRLRGFHEMLHKISKRGKTTSSKSGRFTVPHTYFGHFYVLGVLWTTCLLGSMWYYACRTTKAGENPMANAHLWNTVFVLLLMETQVIRRLYESYMVFKSDSSARLHFLIYVLGLVYYVAEPISLCGPFALDALIYCQSALKGSQSMPTIEVDVWDYFKPLAKLGWLQSVGAVIFFWGWIHQFRCHKILGSLRKETRANEYFIPRGDWFEVSSCPHYLAEIVMYIGILLVSGGSDLTVWLVWAVVVVNLVFSAAETHRWYLQKFEDYPRSRKVIIPLIY
ncbi:3-oxo-5-alpha-steroid 4-dehydrogenase family protein [Wolffia australiana]